MVQPGVDPDWMAKSEVASAYEDTTVQSAWSKNLAVRHPQLVPLLAKIQMDAQDVNKWSYEIAVNRRNPADVAKKWVDGNRALVASWMSK